MIYMHTICGFVGDPNNICYIKLLQTCLNFFILLNIKNDYVKESIFFSILWKLMGPIQCLVTHILLNIFYVQQKKEMFLMFGTNYEILILG